MVVIVSYYLFPFAIGDNGLRDIGNTNTDSALGMVLESYLIVLYNEPEFVLKFLLLHKFQHVLICIFKIFTDWP